MTPRALFDSIPLKVVLVIVAAVLAFAQLQSQVMTKADKVEVERLNRRLDVLVGAICMTPPRQVQYACSRVGSVQ